MSAKTIIRPIKLHTWFPSNDPLAVGVARLSILREDFFLELCAIKEEIRSLDQNSSGWRRLYFFRRSLAILSEIRGCIETLSQTDAFKELLSAQTKSRQSEFQKLKKQLEGAHSSLKCWRNKLGGHVQHRDVEVALQRMQPDREGFIEAGQILQEVHYRFAGELALDVLVPGMPEQNARSYFEKPIGQIAQLTPVLALIDEILRWYLADRRLL